MTTVKIQRLGLGLHHSALRLFRWHYVESKARSKHQLCWHQLYLSTAL